MAPQLSGHELACRRGGRLVFDSVSFALEAGAALALRGPNGSGKSSLLRLLAGFIAPAAGALLWQGAPVGDDLGLHRTRLHFLGHADAVKGVLTVEENLAWFARLQGGGRAGIEPALAAFGLQGLADWPGRLLSSGQRRRTALARLVAVERPLWLLDEPEVGLDRPSRERLRRVLAGHRERGGIAIVASHGELELEGAQTLELGQA